MKNCLLCAREKPNTDDVCGYCFMKIYNECMDIRREYKEFELGEQQKMFTGAIIVDAVRSSHVHRLSPI
jgi:hypothetical protein